ncbi:MAG: acetate--CoA ligase family protein [Spirochaetes bacterium]|jgi:acetyltransferase|nr:acetate--CoA ligase family protein [Spirochaetota bacterium]
MNRLYNIFFPKSIALAGASNNPLKMGTHHAVSLLTCGYAGKVYLLNPKEEAVLGVRCYRSVADLPEAPDLGIIVIPSDRVASMVDEFGARGTKGLIIVSAGFSEMGAKGADAEQTLMAAASRHGIAFVGPNCMGIINTETGLNTTGLSMDNRPGKLGFISQSGTYISQTASYLAKRGVRFSKAISLGNETSIDLVEALEYLGDDEQTRAIALYIEGIRRGDEFIRAARRISEKKPIIAQYAGGSSAGARSSGSHTGAMAGPDHLYDGVLRQAGITRVDSIEDLYTHGWVLATQPKLRGKRMAVVTNSGGPGTSIADTCSKCGLEVPLFSEKLQEALGRELFAHAPRKNPVDLTFTLDIELLTVRVPGLIMAHNEADGIIIHGAFSSGFLKAAYPNFKDIIKVPLEALLAGMPFNPENTLEFPAKAGVPVLMSSFFDREDNYAEAFIEHGIPLFDSPEKAACAMASLWKSSRAMDRRRDAPESPASPLAVPLAIIKEALARGQRALDEYQSKKVLAAYGIPVARELLSGSPKEAEEAAGRIGYPVTLKACRHDIMHKTEKGLLRLGIQNAPDLRRAFSEIRKAAGGDVPVLVQEMVEGKREFMAGMTRYPGFSPAVVFGLGGIFTEALNDTALRIAPLGRADGLEMMEEIKSSVLLKKFRGMPGANTTALAEMLQRLGELSLLHPEIKEIDCNPILLSDKGPLVVDSLMVIA